MLPGTPHIAAPGFLPSVCRTCYKQYSPGSPYRLHRKGNAATLQPCAESAYKLQSLTAVFSFSIPSKEALQAQRRDFSKHSVILHQERATAADLLRTEDNQHPSAVSPPKPSSLRAQHVQAPTVNQESLGDTRDCWAFAVISCRCPSAICSRCCTELLPKPQSPSHSAPSGHRNQLQVSKEKEPAVFQQLNRTCPSVDSKTEHSFHVL